MAEVTRQRFSLAVNPERLRVVFECDPNVPLQIGPCRHLTTDGGCVFTEANCFLDALCAKGFGSGEKMNGFEPVSFTLTVVAVDDVERWSPKNLSAEVAEVTYLEGLKKHRGILAHRFPAQVSRDD